jgi:hypothetical protein
MDTRTVNAKLAVEAIIADISDRKGLGNEWEQIDEDIQDQIRDTWTLIIRTYMA